MMIGLGSSSLPLCGSADDKLLHLAGYATFLIFEHHDVVRYFVGQDAALKTLARQFSNLWCPVDDLELPEVCEETVTAAFLLELQLIQWRYGMVSHSTLKCTLTVLDNTDQKQRLFFKVLWLGAMRSFVFSMLARMPHTHHLQRAICELPVVGESAYTEALVHISRGNADFFCDAVAVIADSNPPNHDSGARLPPPSEADVVDDSPE